MIQEETALLVLKLQAGEESAFDDLFALYQVKAVRTATLIIGDFSLAEDVTQEAFIKCLFSIDTLNDPYRFYTWFLRILTRSAWNAISRQKKLIPTDEIYDVAENLGFCGADLYPSERAATYNTLYLAIKKLKPKQRTTIILYYFNELSIKEIAQVTASLEATVKSRLHAAKIGLKKSLETYNLHEEELVYEKQGI